MLPQAAENYLAETARVLKPDGRSSLTWLLYSRGLSAAKLHRSVEEMFPHDFEYYKIRMLERPEERVAYDLAWMRSAYERNGLTIIEPLRGDVTYSSVRAPDPRTGAHLHYAYTVIAVPVLAKLAPSVRPRACWLALAALPKAVVPSPRPPTRQTSQIVGVSSRAAVDVCPGGVLVVAGTGFEAAVQDADEAVGELAQGGRGGRCCGRGVAGGRRSPGDPRSELNAHCWRASPRRRLRA